jgi:hypothetical protein
MLRLLNKLTLTILFLSLFSGIGLAQKNDVSPLFSEKDPMQIRLNFSIKEMKKEKDDTVYFPSYLHYVNPSGTWDSLKIDMRARGNFRRAKCFFPPIRVKIKKKDAEGTIFEGNKNLKLVVPCQAVSAHNDLVLKEYLCYKLYEPVSPYYFETRLANLTLVDESGKSPKSYEVKSFWIEDDDVVAKRHGGKIAKESQVLPQRMQPLAATRQDFFAFMIANTDWSSMVQHNIKVMQMENKDYIPLPYDFDMSGLVNANYATTSELLPISNVRQRLYRGFCYSEEMLQQVRQEYLALEPEIMAMVDNLEIGLNPKEIPDFKKYLGEFFVILKNDRLFKDQVLSKCR